MPRMRLLTVSGRTPDKAAMAAWGQGRALVQDGGHRNSAGQGKDGPIAGA